MSDQLALLIMAVVLFPLHLVPVRADGRIMSDNLRFAIVVLLAVAVYLATPFNAWRIVSP